MILYKGGTMSNLGELFRQMRQSKNWSLREAAKHMGISYSYLSVLEKGVDPRTKKDSSPKPDTLRVISQAYDYPYEDLMKAAGYINDDTPPDRVFDLTVFISNMNLIMGNKSMEDLSNDIMEKTGYSITSNQLRSYMNGDIEPFPGTINILSKYARVTPDFWYIFNTEQSWADERKRYDNNILKSSTEKYSKDYILFTGLRDDIKGWVVMEDNIPYIKVAMEAKEKKVNPSSLSIMLETLVSLKDSKDGKGK